MTHEPVDVYLILSPSGHTRLIYDGGMSPERTFDHLAERTRKNSA